MELTWKTLPRPFWYRVGLLPLFSGSLLAWMLFVLPTSTNYILFGQIFLLIGYVLSTIMCLGNPAKFERRKAQEDATTTRRMQRWLPNFLALANLCDTIAIALYTSSTIFPTVHIANWPDVFFLCNYPLLLISILSLPVRRLSAAARSRIVLDGLMIMKRRTKDLTGSQKSVISSLSSCKRYHKRP